MAVTQSYLPSRWYITSPQFANDPDIFPLLPGFSFIVSKKTQWNTGISQANSGRERRRMNWSYPLWSFNVAFEVLRDGPSFAELQKLQAFFNAHAGKFTEFFFFDPSDNQVINQPFGTGDGTTRTFQLSRTIGTGALTYVEPIRGVVNTPTVTVSGTTMSAPIGVNRLTYSQAFDNSAWAKTNATITPNSITAPDGTTTADTMVRAATGNHFINQAVDAGTSYVGRTVTFSVWIKAGTLTGDVALVVRDAAGTTDFGVATITPTATWTRYSVTGTGPIGAGAGLNAIIDPINNTGSAGDSLYLWGAQIEVGATPTSYVYTTNSSGDYSIGPLGQITFASAPASGAPLFWFGNFMFLCRFDQDDMDTQQMMQGLWSQSGLNLITVKS